MEQGARNMAQRVWADPENIAFGKLQEADLPLMFKWLNAPHVARWWPAHKRFPSEEAVRKKYLPRIKEEEPTTCYTILYGGLPIGMVQAYRVDDYPAHRAIVDTGEPAAGIDIFIGEEDYVHKGLGSVILKKFLGEIVFANYDVACCVLDPEPANKIAIRCYEKTGFRHVRTVWNEIDRVYSYVMKVDRAEFCAQLEMC